MSNKNGSGGSSGGVGAGFLLFLVFLVLKLCDVIDWSWWWVTAPLWMPFSFVMVLLLIFGGAICAAFLFTESARFLSRKR